MKSIEKKRLHSQVLNVYCLLCQFRKRPKRHLSITCSLTYCIFDIYTHNFRVKNSESYPTECVHSNQLFDSVACLSTVLPYFTLYKFKNTNAIVAKWCVNHSHSVARSFRRNAEKNQNSNGNKMEKICNKSCLKQNLWRNFLHNIKKNTKYNRNLIANERPTSNFQRSQQFFSIY